MSNELLNDLIIFYVHLTVFFNTMTAFSNGKKISWDDKPSQVIV